MVANRISTKRSLLNMGLDASLPLIMILLLWCVVVPRMFREGTSVLSLLSLIAASTIPVLIVVAVISWREHTFEASGVTTSLHCCGIRVWTCAVRKTDIQAVTLNRWRKGLRHGGYSYEIELSLTNGRRRSLPLSGDIDIAHEYLRNAAITLTVPAIQPEWFAKDEDSAEL